MVEPVSIAGLIASVGALIAIIFDKMKDSRCTRIICCSGCCECDRELTDE